MTYPTLDVLRLEVEMDPTTGLVNLVQNANGTLGGWEWLTPTPGATIRGTTVSGEAALLYTAAADAGGNFFSSGKYPMTAGQYVGARVRMLTTPHPFFRARFRFWNAAQTATVGTTAWVTHNGNAYINMGPDLAPANTVWVDFEVEFGTAAGTYPLTTGGGTSTFRYATMAVAATAAGLSTTRENMVEEPSFESDPLGEFEWLREGATLTSVASGVAVHGARVGRLVATAAGVVRLTTGLVVGPLTVGERHTFYGHVRAETTPREWTMRVHWRDAAGVTVLTQVVAVAADSTSAWTRMGGVLTPPAGAVNCQLSMEATVASGEAHLFDAFLGEVGDLLDYPFYIVGIAAGSYLVASTEPPFRDVLGPTHSIKVVREELSLGTLSAEILDAALDPAASTLIRPGRRVRLAALLSGVWESVFTGKVSAAKVVYEPLRTDEKTARITLEAVDNIATLAATSRPDGVATVDALPYVLEGAGVPWNVNGSGDQVAAATVASVNVNASALDQVGVTRDTVRGYAWVDRRGVLQAWDAASMSRPGWTTAEADYTALRVDFDMDRCINTVLIKYLRYAAGETEEVPYGPYVDAASVAEWGPRRAEFTIHGGTESPAAMQAFADAVLAANSTPTRTVNEMVLPVVGASTLTRAKLDLYDAVTVTNTAAGITAQVVPVARVEHDISPGKWLVTLGFAKTGSVASPQISPPVQTQGDAWIAATLQNSWLNLGSGFAEAKYRRHNGVVFVQGVVFNGTNGAAILTLPAGYRPAAQIIFATEVSSNTHARLDVAANGEMKAPLATSNAYLSISCCFIAEA